MDRGQPGALGVNLIEGADGRVDALTHISNAKTPPEDVFVIQARGGGGYGPAA